jgi:hypothetical protein
VFSLAANGSLDFEFAPETGCSGWDRCYFPDSFKKKGGYISKIGYDHFLPISFLFSHQLQFI